MSNLELISIYNFKEDFIKIDSRSAAVQVK